MLIKTRSESVPEDFEGSLLPLLYIGYVTMNLCTLYVGQLKSRRVRWVRMIYRRKSAKSRYIRKYINSTTKNICIPTYEFRPKIYASKLIRVICIQTYEFIMQSCHIYIYVYTITDSHGHDMIYITFHI